MVWDISLSQNKTNYLLSWIDNITCVVGPKCEHTQLIFLSKSYFLIICLNFQQQNSFKIQYLSHLKYENYQINFIKSNSTTTFQQHQVHLWIQINFFSMILLNFTNKMVQ
jgi:hypothetical protein